MAADRAPVLLPDGRQLRGAQTPDEINIADYMLLARKLAWKWHKRFDSVEDAVQVAMIGLCKARERWEPTRGPFEAIAPLYIRSEFKVEARKRQVRAPLNLPAARVNADGEELDLTQTLADDAPGAEEVLIEREEASYPRQRIAEALASLNDRERQIIEARYLADEPAKLQELSEALGISRERVRQIEVKALGLLREVIAAEIPFRTARSVRRPGRPKGSRNRAPATGHKPDAAVVAAALAAAPRGLGVSDTLRALMRLPSGVTGPEAALIWAELFPGRAKPQLQAFSAVATKTTDPVRGVIYRLPQ